MFDINFYRKIYSITKQIEQKNITDKELLFELFDDTRNKLPIVYNIETTNACNMKCTMCPRTTKMTRPIETIDSDTFSNIIKQLTPFSVSEWNKWKTFVETTYNIYENDMSENHFFLYIIPKIIQLHGYGDPLLDKNIESHVKVLGDNGFNSYFSCNPANINVEKTKRMFDAGLSYIKYSIESVDDLKHKKIRGDCSNFVDGYNKIIDILDIKEKMNYNTTVVITMLDLNNDKQKEEYDALTNAFKGLNVYIYLKSQDQQWYNTIYHGTNSIHWSEICKHPWMSMTIKSNADVVMCMEDYNNEIILGNAKKDSLYNIWNGKKYIQFRKDHFNSAQNIKCTNECDMDVVGKYLNDNIH